MKIMITALLMGLLAGSLLAEQRYELKFEVLENQGIAGGNFDVLIQVRTGNEGFALGSCNLVFQYDPEVLGEPQLLKAQGFSGEAYRAMSLSNPTEGRLSINVLLNAAGEGTAVGREFSGVAAVRFKIADAGGIARLDWRIEPPNATLVFADDEQTLLTAGSLTGLEMPIPSAQLDSDGDATVSEFTVFQNYPNPFNPATYIRYALPHPAEVKIAVYDVQGQLVRTLLNGPQPAGHHAVGFDAAGLASGVYFYRVNSAGLEITRKMLLLK